MIKLTVTLVTNISVTLYLSNNFAFSTNDENQTTIKDGIHKNGGWRVKQTHAELIAQVDEQLAKKS